MTVYSLIEEQLKSNPNKKIISFKDQELSLQQFKAEYEKMAVYLNHSGIKRGDIVGLCVDRSLEMVIALVAIIKCGATYLPIDPVFPANRIKLMLDDSNCRFLISDKTLFDSFNNYSGNLLNINQYNEITSFNELPDFSDENDTAYIIYTSGSTGIPKGVQITHKSLTNLLLSVRKQPGLNEHDSFLAISTLSFDISLVELLLPLISGARLVIASKEDVRDGQILLKKLKNKITVFQATPVTWKMLIDSGWNEKLNIKAISTGEALPRDLANSILERVDTLWNMYGPTETTIFSSGGLVEKDGIIHIGRPIDNTQFYIVDKNYQLCAPGVVGELLIGGVGLSIGYFNKGELTKEKFITNPFDKSGSSKVYKTGDLVRLTFDKKIEFLDRIDNQVKIRGYRIELGEIEVEIKKNDNIRDCVAVVKEFAQGDKRIVAFYITNGTPEISSDNTEALVSRWKDNYDNMYENAISNENKKDNNNIEIGYLIVKEFEHDNSFRDQFKVWIDETTKRIRELNPNIVLEIGCGGGDILKRILPECSIYCATDLSPKVIEYLKNDIINIEKGNAELKLHSLPADADLPFGVGFFDTIIMNSVVPNFPSENYLLKVINKLTSHLTNKGSFFIGDVQSFSLMKNLYTFEQLSRIPKSLKVKEFKLVVSNKLRTAPEFFIDPEYFFKLSENNEKIKRVEIKIMRGSINNDPTIYHYDVLFFTDNKNLSANLRTINWGSEVSNLEKIEQILDEDKPEILYVQDIPNKRICIRKEIELAIENADADSFVSEVIASVKYKNNDIDPEEVWEMENNINYKIDLILPENGDQTKFDAVFISKKIENKSTYPLRKISQRKNVPSSYCNQPYIKLSNENIIEKIKQNLSVKLPDYMRPSFYIPIDSFPVTPTGKIDRKALSLKAISDVALVKKISKPTSDIEKRLADIWAKVLDIPEIGMDDNFFELGGHSILIISMLAHINKEFDISLSVGDIFRLPTVADIANEIIKAKVNKAEEPAQPISVVSRESYRLK